MTHPHTQIRGAVVRALRADPVLRGIVGDRVWGGRLKAVRGRDCPQIVVYLPSDRADKDAHDGDGQGPISCEATLVVEIVFAAQGDDMAGESLEDGLDTVAERVEALLDAFEVPNRLADVFRYRKTDSDVLALPGKETEEAFVSRGIVYGVAFSRERSVGGLVAAALSGSSLALDIPLVGDPGRADLPVGTVKVIAVRVGDQPMDRAYDWRLSDDGRAVERIPNGHIPAGATLRVVVEMPSVPSGLYFGVDPNVGPDHIPDYRELVG